MIGMVIAAHGGFGKELLNSASLVVGPVKGCASWSLNPGDNIERTGQKLKELLEAMDQEGGGIVFTDIWGGTPANLALKYSRNKKIKVISGASLPMILEFMNLREELGLDETCARCVEAARRGSVIISDLFNERRKENG
ncbi:PTS sugar transporter subunit IIA [Anaerostipes sp.]|uniref:PTS sugar transporter subunit IIA n=1 Tax=Anaerostipes sp. TaxID=1872530 RepID=UPI0025C02F04|nr:PTS sugar transporter subunit IIA [Anaerostipes sp.]MBS7009007.1 PTS sugar transporter subunit IIA [Anaerostipes sp.]